MSIIQRVSHIAKPFESNNKFTGTFNVPTVGVYDFTNVAANQDQQVMTVDPGAWYFIDRVSFSSTLAEGVYLAAINTLPLVRLKFQRDGREIYPQALPLMIYKNNLELNFWFKDNSGTMQDPNNLLIDCTGVLNQVAVMVGTAAVDLFASFLIYKELDQKVIRILDEGSNTNAAEFNE